ncbi:armadillo-type protein [Trichoderma longibrachiatum]
MPKPRTKRGAARDERKRKHSDTAKSNSHENKRQRRDDDQGDYNNDNTTDYNTHDAAAYGGESNYEHHGGPGGEREFFGMLADDEQEYFRRADEMLELNQFPTPEDRDVFLQSVYREARGKELKIASSQSCSRLMERLIQLASTSQKKQLFEAFGGHFLSLVQHRFASHCCEALFLRSAGVVTQELAGFTGFVMDTKGADVDEQQPEASMEHLFLATLDELEGSLGYLITDRFASHTLRVLLLVLSGMPLEEQSSRTLLKSKRKEKITVIGSTEADAQNRGKRAVPASFIMAANKIMQDSVEGMDATAIQVLAKHPIGNPILQLILELDLTLNKGEAKGEAKGEDGQTSNASPSLLQKLLPGAPKSLSDGSSAASEFVNGMIYDQIGSRLIETLVTHAPGKIFKALNQNIFLPRIQGYVRNDISCYPAIRVLQRLGKDDLAKAVDQIAPTVPQLVSKARYNVLTTLFERCAARNINDEIKKLIKGLKEGCGSQPADLVMTLCSLSASEEEEKKKKKDVNQLTKNEYAVQSHGAKLLTTLLSISGPSKAVHESILALPSDLVLRLANTSLPTVTLLTTAINTPSSNSVFQKGLVNTLLPRIPDLAMSQYGHNLVNAIAEIPSKGKDWSIPQHIKDKVMTALAAHESQLRESWMGRSVWRTWKGDMWKTRRFDWKNWMKELDEMKAPAAAAPKNKGDVKGNNDERRTAKDEEDVEQKDAQPDEAPEDVNGHGNGDGHEEDASTRKEKKKDKKSKKEKKEKKKEAEEAEEGGEPQEKKKKKRKEKNKSKDGDVEMADAEE